MLINTNESSDTETEATKQQPTTLLILDLSQLNLLKALRKTHNLLRQKSKAVLSLLRSSEGCSHRTNLLNLHVNLFCKVSFIQIR